MMMNFPRTALILFTYSLILCLVPLGFILCNWQWQSQADFQLPINALLLITETASLPYAIISSLCLLALLCAFNTGYLPRKTLLCVIALSLISTQLEQKLLKKYFALPRPYITTINAEQQRRDVDFYALKKEEKKQIVRLWHQQRSPHLSTHRIKEIGYRFPSGHSIFSVSWVLLFAAFCRKRWLCFTLALWSAAVMATRIYLGMHLPQDLLAGIVLALLNHLFLIAVFCFRRQDKRQALA